MFTFRIKKFKFNDEVSLSCDDGKYFGDCLNYPLGLYYASDIGTDTLVEFDKRLKQHGFTPTADETLGYTNGEISFKIFEFRKDLFDPVLDKGIRISSIWDFAYKYRYDHIYNRTYIVNN